MRGKTSLEDEQTLSDKRQSRNYEQIRLLILEIENLQSKASDAYPSGLFPSQRFHTLLPYRREDNNVFFTALIVFTLQQILPFLDEVSKEIAKKICSRAIETYPLYRSRRGLMTYNFWQNTPNKHFYPGYLFHKLNFLALPDDADDTVLIYLTKPRSGDDVLGVKEELAKHANKSKAQIKNTFPQFKALRAYTTWFGKNMYLEFDFCVLCNVMYFVCSNNLPFSNHDEDTLSYLKGVIETDLHISHPFQVSASYPRTILILYHLTRLVTAFEIPQLKGLKPKITEQLHQLEKQRLHTIDRILIAISIARITGVCPNVDYKLPIHSQNYYFFNGGLLTAFEHKLARKLAPFNIFHLKHTCEAYYLALLVEYEILKITSAQVSPPDLSKGDQV